jgi:FkbM family methyltransferase
MTDGGLVARSWSERLAWRIRGWHLRGMGRLRMGLTPRHGERVVPIVGDLRMRLDLGDDLQRLMYLGLLHHDLLPSLPRLLPLGGTFLDVGANVGFFTLHGVRLVGPRGRVLAVEAVPRTSARLQANLALNGLDAVEVSCLALCDHDGPFSLRLPPAEAKKDYLVSHHGDGWEEVVVPGRTLETFLAEHRVSHVDLMKIDIEGGEPLVFRAARDLLLAGRVRAVMCEINGPQLARSGLTCRGAVEELLAVGFHLLLIGRNGRLHRRDDLPRFDDRRDYNLLLRHRDAPLHDA